MQVIRVLGYSGSSQIVHQTALKDIESRGMCEKPVEFLPDRGSIDQVLALYRLLEARPMHCYLRITVFLDSQSPYDRLDRTIPLSIVHRNTATEVR